MVKNENDTLQLTSALCANVGETRTPFFLLDKGDIECPQDFLLSTYKYVWVYGAWAGGYEPFKNPHEEIRVEY